MDLKRDSGSKVESLPEYDATGKHVLIEDCTYPEDMCGVYKVYLIPFKPELDVCPSDLKDVSHVKAPLHKYKQYLFKPNSETDEFSASDPMPMFINPLSVSMV